MNEQKKNGFSCIWSMFSTIFRYSTTKTDQYVKDLSLSFPNLKTIEKLLQICFYCLFLFRPIVEIVCILFRPHSIISASMEDFELYVIRYTK